jgi:hypothetical protein
VCSVSYQSVVFWVVTPYSYVGGPQLFEGICCFNFKATETSISTYKTTQCHNREDHDVNIRITPWKPQNFSYKYYVYCLVYGVAIDEVWVGNWIY